MSNESEWASYVPSPQQARQLDALLALLKQCDAVDLPICVFGGYGLDALYGKLTRDHHDFDIIVATDNQEPLIEILMTLGYEHVPAWSEVGRKDCYIQRELGPDFVLELATIDEAKLAYVSQQHGIDADLSLVFPPEPNGQLLGQAMRTPTLQGIEIVNQIQRQTGSERGWDEFPHRQHQEALLAFLRQKS